MLLAMADFAERKGFKPETSLWVHATELSIHTYHMCYVQLAARGLASRVIRGNSLSMDVFSWAYLPATPMFLNMHGEPVAEQRGTASNCNKYSNDPDELKVYENPAAEKATYQLDHFD